MTLSRNLIVGALVNEEHDPQAFRAALDVASEDELGDALRIRAELEIDRLNEWQREAAL